MLPDEVMEAVEWLDRRAPDAAWQTVKAHLLAREAEVERLAGINKRLCTDFNVQNLHGARLDDRVRIAEADLEAANKAVDTYREMLVSIIKVVRERDDRQLQAHIDATGITAHLSENGH